VSSKAQTVLWAGLLLVVVRAVTSGQWKQIWGTIGNAPASTGNTSATPASGTPPQGASITPYATGYQSPAVYTQQAQVSATGSPGNVPLVAGGQPVNVYTH